MPALGMVLVVILGIMILAGAAYWTWKLERTGNADDVANAIGKVAKAAGTTAEEVSKKPEQITTGVILVGIGIALYFVLR